MDNLILRTVLIVLAAFVLFALINYYNNKQASLKTEKFFNMNQVSSGGTQSGAQMPQQPMQQTSTSVPDPIASPPPTIVSGTNGTIVSGSETKCASVEPSDPLSDMEFKAVDYQGTKLPSDCFPKDRMTVEDLLPKDAANSKWAQVNPAGQGDVKDQNFLTAGYMFGINTVGSSLKNPNLQLRSEPVIPKVSVGPFLNSSYEASDALRRPLEIGGDC